jgi:uncharacterized protein (DUF433 family)
MEYNQKSIGFSRNEMSGKPFIKGTKVTLRVILKKLSEGMSIENIVNFYPELSISDIYDSLEFASVAVEKVKPKKEIISNLTIEEQKEMKKLQEELFGKNGKYKDVFK